MLKTRIFLLLTLFAFFSCTPDSQTDYVELQIPESLKDNEEAVKKLESDARKLNNVFNSFEDIMNDFLAFKQDIDSLSEDDDINDFKRSMKRKNDKLGRDVAGFMFNIIWLSMKDYEDSKKHKVILKTLTEGNKIEYRKCLKHLNIKKDIIKQKIDEFEKGLEELSKSIKRKEELIDRKLKN